MVVEQTLQALMEDPVVAVEEDVVELAALETLLLLVLHKEEMVEVQHLQEHHQLLTVVAVAAERLKMELVVQKVPLEEMVEQVQHQVLMQHQLQEQVVEAVVLNLGVVVLVEQVVEELEQVDLLLVVLMERQILAVVAEVKVLIHQMLETVAQV